MAVLNPIPLFPLGDSAIDASVINRFTWDFIGTEGESQISFQLVIRLLDNTLIHDSGVVSSNNNFYDLPASTLTNGLDYVWRITTVSGAFTTTNRIPIVFKARTTPTLSIDTLPSPFQHQFYTFTATYTQVQSVEVRDFIWTLYDNSDVEISNSGRIVGTTVEHEFTGLENGNTYKIDVTATNQLNQTVTSSRLTFTAIYTRPFDPDAIVVEGLSNLALNRIDWTAVVAQTGQVVDVSDTPVTPTYITGVWGQALSLQTGQRLIYDLNAPIPANFSEVKFLQLPSNYHGNFFELYSNGLLAYKIGYDNVKDKFYYERGIGKSQRRTYGLQVTLPTDWFRFVVKPKEVFYEISNTIYQLR